MVGRARHTLAIAASLWAGVARAEGRVDLLAGAGRRDERLSADEDLHARGGAMSDLSLSGMWLGRRLGLAGTLAIERFTFDRTVDVLGAAGGAALVLRAELQRFEGRLEVGYGARRIPAPVATLSPAGLPGLASTALGAHGPTIGAALGWSSAPCGVEVAGEAFAVGLGAHYLGRAVTPRRLAARAQVRLGRWELGGLRWAALVSGELARTSARGEGVSFADSHASVALGLRATWVLEKKPARLRLVARVAGQPAADVALTVEGGLVVHTDQRGQAWLAGLPPGPLLVRVGGPGWQDGDEVVEFPASGEATAGLTVSRVAPVVSAVSGVVRAEGGGPVRARVEILERDTHLTTDGGGGFRLELPPGRYTLSISADGFLPQERGVAARPNEESIYNVELRRAP
jgi:hypothetical protein